jgi:hypothetical protein
MLGWQPPIRWRGFIAFGATGKPFNLPLEQHAVHDGLILRFTDELDKTESEDPSNYAVKIWGLNGPLNTARSITTNARSRSAVHRLAPDGKTIHLSIPQIQPTWCMGNPLPTPHPFWRTDHHRPSTTPFTNFNRLTEKPQLSVRNCDE